MTSKQAKILGQFFYQVAELANQTLTAFVESEEKQVSIATLSAQAAQPEKGLLNRKQLAERLNVSVRSVDNLISDGLEHLKIGERVLFDYEKVLTWIEGKEVKSRRKKNLRMVG